MIVMENEYNNENDDVKEKKSKKYSLDQILNSKSCQISKEKELYLWNNSIFSQKLYGILTAKDSEIISKYEKFYRYIENILMGDFCTSKEKTIYLKDFFYASYILNSEEDNLHLLYMIYFTDDKDKLNYFLEKLEFLDILEGTNDLQSVILNFQNEHLYSYKYLEYDKHCLLDSNVFFKFIKNENGKLIRYPYDFEIIKKSDKEKNIERCGEKSGNKGFINFQNLVPKSITKNVLNILRNKETLDYDLLFKNKIFN